MRKMTKLQNVGLALSITTAAIVGILLVIFGVCLLVAKLGSGPVLSLGLVLAFAGMLTVGLYEHLEKAQSRGSSKKSGYPHWDD